MSMIKIEKRHSIRCMCFKLNLMCRMKLIDILLDYCRTKLDYETDKTKLLTMVQELIATEYDVNAADNMQMTPLHVAVSYSLNDVVIELIHAGADLDVQDNVFRGTALHHAVKVRNVELCCMLLAYGADVSLLHRNDMTPFMYALDTNTEEIAELLFDYYDDFSYQNVDGYNSLLLAAEKRMSMAIRLLQVGGDVNCCPTWDLNVLSLSLRYDSCELFKLVWPRFDHRISLNSSVPFLLRFMRGCRFPTGQWLECLYLILESDKAFDLIWSYLDCDPSIVKSTFLSNLILAFYKRKVKPDDRLTLIYLCLSLGVEASFDDVVYAYKFYGFGQELMALIYVGNYEAKLVKYSGSNLLLPTIILALEEDYGSAAVFESLKDQILYGYDLPEVTKNNILNTLTFFSLPCSLKTELLQFSQIRSTNQSDNGQISNSIEAMAEIPTLVELCRNRTRSLLRQFYTIEKPYQFYDVLQSLRWPQLIKDIVCFKMPIYK